MKDPAVTQSAFFRPSYQWAEESSAIIFSKVLRHSESDDQNQTTGYFGLMPN